MAAPNPPPPAAGQALQNAPVEPLRRTAPLTDRSGAGAPGTNAGVALVPSPRHPEDDEGPVFSPRVMRLPVELDVAVPVRDFRVRRLLALAPEQLIESQWSSGKDLPLAAGDVRLAWTEFEVVETRLAVRVTRVE
jgi:flagellar motor switch/type III secretory pathway protein FliN